MAEQVLVMSCACDCLRRWHTLTRRVPSGQRRSVPSLLASTWMPMPSLTTCLLFPHMPHTRVLPENIKAGVEAPAALS
jgi:hypothetical protein